MSGHRFTFFDALNLIVNDYGERVTDDDLLQHLLGVYDQPDFRPGMDVLSSFLSTRESAVTTSGLRAVARMFSRRHGALAPRNLVAAVVRTPLGHGLARLYSAYADRDGEVTVKIFRSLVEAADWLDASRDRPAGTTARAMAAAPGSRARSG